MAKRCCDQIGVSSGQNWFRFISCPSVCAGRRHPCALYPVFGACGGYDSHKNSCLTANRHNFFLFAQAERLLLIPTLAGMRRKRKQAVKEPQKPLPLEVEAPSHEQSRPAVSSYFYLPAYIEQPICFGPTTASNNTASFRRSSASTMCAIRPHAGSTPDISAEERTSLFAANEEATPITVIRAIITVTVEYAWPCAVLSGQLREDVAFDNTVSPVNEVVTDLGDSGIQRRLFDIHVTDQASIRYLLREMAALLKLKSPLPWEAHFCDL
ncbi:unnamed protein product [Soboliphyme baturini]|uniref:Kazal-like domain-containing protein n=1 Tax=Soboliphyme baturini TaxID=241478 RepID=A0A183IBM9_9BILA|nr:unnamed protein product [Soboliphyme baturini]